jgi:glycosyltransferase involved in cell wall biosynthesis
MRRILHITDSITIGGALRVIENHCLPRRAYETAIIGFRGDERYIRDLRSRGADCVILAAEAEWSAYLADQSPEQTGIVIHRSGFETPEWNRVLEMLGAKKFRRVVERNIFGFCDTGPSSRHIEKICFNSKHSLWRGWRQLDAPPIRDFLERHCVLNNPVLVAPAEEEVAGFRRSARERYGVPCDAFVIGDLCRPAPEKLDAMLLGVAGALRRRIPNLWVVTRCYPVAIARAMKWRLGARYLNLPVTSDPQEALETLSMMDAFVHMSTMGESFGMANVEAMRCGIPVICNETPKATCNNAQRELIRDGETGFFANDPLRLVEVLHKLSVNPDKRRSIGMAARRESCSGALDPQVIEANLEKYLFADEAGGDWQAPSKREMAAYLESYDGAFVVPPRRAAPPLVVSTWAWRVGWRAYRKICGGS